jgi:hypothetical protein
MSIQDLGGVGELIAAIATVATLAYLAIQIRANTKVARAESLQTVLDGARDRIYVPSHNNPEISEVFPHGMNEFDELSEQDQRRFYWVMSEWIFQLQHVWQLYEKGLASQMDYDAWLYAVATMAKTDGGAQAWQYMQATITPTIKKVLNDYLAEHPDLPSFIEIIPLMRYGRSHDDGGA